jgi:hypothetical protein
MYEQSWPSTQRFLTVSGTGAPRRETPSPLDTDNASGCAHCGRTHTRNRTEAPFIVGLCEACLDAKDNW